MDGCHYTPRDVRTAPSCRFTRMMGQQIIFTSLFSSSDDVMILARQSSTLFLVHSIAPTHSSLPQNHSTMMTFVPTNIESHLIACTVHHRRLRSIIARTKFHPRHHKLNGQKKVYQVITPVHSSTFINLANPNNPTGIKKSSTDQQIELSKPIFALYGPGLSSWSR